MSILAHHIIYSTYGFWLPNDPRGSWSTFVGSGELYRKFGHATKVTGRESVAREPHDHARRLAAKQLLKYPPVEFTGRQAREVALAIGDVGQLMKLTILACAVMPDHVHVVVVRSAFAPAKIIAACRSRSSRRLRDAGLWNSKRPIWGRGKWTVFLDDERKVRAAIHYVEQNPIRASFPRQRWTFVKRWEYADT